VKKRALLLLMPGPLSGPACGETGRGTPLEALDSDESCNLAGQAGCAPSHPPNGTEQCLGPGATATIDLH
jgi:hypothetical protein